MTAILKHCVFIHIPKTGGSWVTAALDQAGLIADKMKYCSKHYNIDEILRFRSHLKDAYFFAFVRNPVTWWPSRWSCNWNRHAFFSRIYVGAHNWHNPYKHAIDMPPNNHFCVPKAAGVKSLIAYSNIRNLREYNNFPTWANRVINKDPAWMSRYFQSYIGENYDWVDFIGKYENLQTDLIDFLKKCGENFEPQSIKQTEKVNESNKKFSRKWNPKLLQKVLKAEGEFMKRFGYSTNIDDYINS